MERYHEQKIKHLISLRSSLITVLIVLVGGLFGLHLLNLPPLIYWCGLCVGMYFSGIFGLNLISVNTDILSTLEDIKDE